jgi:hypothetical protein
MHVVAPKPADPKLPIFFNVTASVGQSGSNSNADDILLVQFFLRSIAEGVAATKPGGEARRQRMLKVPFSGSADALTIDGIRAWQEGAKLDFPNTVVDGKVSVAQGYLYGGAMWTITHMNAAFRSTFPKIWPKLQDHALCPPALKLRVKQVL